MIKVFLFFSVLLFSCGEVRFSQAPSKSVQNESSEEIPKAADGEVDSKQAETSPTESLDHSNDSLKSDSPGETQRTLESSNANVIKETSSPAPSSVPGNEKEEGDKPEEARKAKVADFGLWCKKFTLTPAYKVATLKSLHGDLCDTNGAKDLFTKTLIEKAYSGQGEPQIHAVRALSSAPDRTTSFRAGYALKLPVSAKLHAEKIAPKSFEIPDVVALLVCTGGKGSANILATYKNETPEHVQGALIRTYLEKQVSIAMVRVESEHRIDNYNLADGELYVTSSSITKPIQGVHVLDSISAIVQHGSDAYVITIIEIKMPNQGFPRIAEPEMLKSALAGAKTIFQRIQLHANALPK